MRGKERKGKLGKLIKIRKAKQFGKFVSLCLRHHGQQCRQGPTSGPLSFLSEHQGDRAEREQALSMLTE